MQSSARDKAMAENLVYIATKLFPDEKIMVWAHSYHNMRNPQLLNTAQGIPVFPGDVTMGDEAYKKLGDEIYNIAFISYDGAISNNQFSQNYTCHPAPEGSVEWCFHELGYKYGFVDLKNLPKDHWLATEEVLARFIATSMNLANWPKICDAFVYIQTAKPKTLREDDTNW
jgi:erythromycin esterase